jgi:hypothetical protein
MKARLLCLALAAPALLAAQQPAPLPPNPLTAMFRTRTVNYQRLLAQAFDSIPESRFGYKPTPAQQTIGYIAQHLADDNYFYCGSFGPLKGTRAAADTATADTVKAKWPRDSLLAKLRTSFKFCEDALAQLDDAKLVEPIQVRQGSNVVTITRAQRVVGHIIDLVDHYSQIANYMRLNGMLPPTALPRPRP